MLSRHLECSTHPWSILWQSVGVSHCRHFKREGHFTILNACLLSFSTSYWPLSSYYLYKTSMVQKGWMLKLHGWDHGLALRELAVLQVPETKRQKDGEGETEQMIQLQPQQEEMKEKQVPGAWSCLSGMQVLPEKQTNKQKKKCEFSSIPCFHFYGYEG